MILIIITTTDTPDSRRDKWQERNNDPPNILLAVIIASIFLEGCNYYSKDVIIKLDNTVLVYYTEEYHKMFF